MREDIDSLTALGFCGFHTIRELRAKKLSMVPKQKGVYLVLRLSEEPVRFLDKSLGGHFEGKDPKVLIAKLCKEWVDGATILYIGKAGGPIGKAGGPKKNPQKNPLYTLGLRHTSNLAKANLFPTGGEGLFGK